jgi:hydrophobic/amphiphilic exporter-1 (mainly G- bacteria), HAE1 family
LTDLEELSVVTPAGARIKIKELGEIQEYWSPPNIERKRRERIVTVSAKPDRIALGELAGLIHAGIADLAVPQEVILNIGGAYEEQQESFMDLGLLHGNQSDSGVYCNGLPVRIVYYAVCHYVFHSVCFYRSGPGSVITGTTLSLVAASGSRSVNWNSGEKRNRAY